MDNKLVTFKNRNSEVLSVPRSASDQINYIQLHGFNEAMLDRVVDSIQLSAVDDYLYDTKFSVEPFLAFAISESNWVMACKSYSQYNAVLKRDTWVILIPAAALPEGVLTQEVKIKIIY